MGLGHIGCGQGGQLALGSGQTGSGQTGSGQTGWGQTGALQIGALYKSFGQLHTGAGQAGGLQTHLKKANRHIYGAGAHTTKKNLLSWLGTERLSVGSIARGTGGAAIAVWTAVKVYIPVSICHPN